MSIFYILGLYISKHILNLFKYTLHILNLDILYILNFLNFIVKLVSFEFLLCDLCCVCLRQCMHYVSVVNSGPTRGGA